MTDEERYQRIMELHRDGLHFTLISLGFCVVSFISLIALKKAWLPFWLMGQGGYFWAWNQSRKCSKEIRELKNGGGRSNRN